MWGFPSGTPISITGDDKTYYESNGGVVYADVRVGIPVPAGPVSSVVIDPATPTTIYAGLDGGGVYKKTATTDWAAVTTQPANLRVKALVFKPGDSSTLYAASYGSGLYKSTNSTGNSANNGMSWAACAGQPTNLNLVSLTIDAAGKLYAGSEAGVFVSTDGCGTWTALNNGLPN